MFLRYRPEQQKRTPSSTLITYIYVYTHNLAIAIGAAVVMGKVAPYSAVCLLKLIAFWAHDHIIEALLRRERK